MGGHLLYLRLSHHIAAGTHGDAKLCMRGGQG